MNYVLHGKLHFKTGNAFNTVRNGGNAFNIVNISTVTNYPRYNVHGKVLLSNEGCFIYFLKYIACPLKVFKPISNYLPSTTNVQGSQFVKKITYNLHTKHK